MSNDITPYEPVLEGEIEPAGDICPICRKDMRRHLICDRGSRDGGGWMAQTLAGEASLREAVKSFNAAWAENLPGVKGDFIIVDVSTRVDFRDIEARAATTLSRALQELGNMLVKSKRPPEPVVWIDEMEGYLEPKPPQPAINKKQMRNFEPRATKANWKQQVQSSRLRRYKP